MKLSEMWNYMKKFYKMVQMDHPTIVFYVITGGIARATGPFLALLYSSKILDSLLSANVDQAQREVAILLIGSFIFGCIDKACYQVVHVVSASSLISVWKQTAHKAYIVQYEKYERTETLDKIRRAQNGSNGSGGVDIQIRNTYIFVSSVISVGYALLFTIQLLVKSFTASNFLWYTLLLAVVFTGFLKILMSIQKRNAQKEMEVNHENEHGNSLWGYLFNSSLNVKNGKDIRLYKMQGLILHWFQHIMHFTNKSFSSYADYAAFSNGLVALLTQVFAGGVYIYVGISVLEGVISIGNVLLYTGSITRMANELNQAISRYNMIAYRFEYLGNLEEFIQSKNMNYDGTLPIEKRDDYEYEFEFRNVSFKYPGTEQYVLKNVNLKLDINKRLAIVGQNGAGKTTLIKLLCRLYEPTEGEILLNGINIQKYDYAEYTNIFSVVFQDFILFPLPLDENIASGAQVDEDRCMEVLESVGLKETVMTWPEKQHTRLYKDLGDGINVSGGEAQKIAIARALYKDAPFVIMDEPTAALDPIAEAEIYENFNSLIREKTAIFISHRMSSCKFCDKIIVFEDGEIIQEGSHRELVEKEGLYRQLWEAQAQYYA